MGHDRKSLRHIIHVFHGALFVCLAACFALAGQADAQQASEAPRYVMRVYTGPCNAEDSLAQAGAESAPPLMTPAPPFQAAVFTLEIDGSIADLVAEPVSLAVELIDGELAVVAACGDLPQGAGGEAVVVSLLSPVSGALVGVAEVTEAAPGQLRIDAWLMVPATEGEDIPVDSTAQPEPEDDDAEQPGGV